MTESVPEPVIKTIEVACNTADAFDVFVVHTSSWWPLSKHAVSAGAGKTALSVTIEPKLGGAIYEPKFDGVRVEWGQVLEFKPGKRLLVGIRAHPRIQRRKCLWSFAICLTGDVGWS